MILLDPSDENHTTRGVNVPISSGETQYLICNVQTTPFLLGAFGRAATSDADKRSSTVVGISKPYLSLCLIPISISNSLPRCHFLDAAPSLFCSRRRLAGQNTRRRPAAALPRLATPALDRAHRSQAPLRANLARKVFDKLSGRL